MLMSDEEQRQRRAAIRAEVNRIWLDHKGVVPFSVAQQLVGCWKSAVSPDRPRIANMPTSVIPHVEQYLRAIVALYGLPESPFLPKVNVQQEQLINV